MSSVLQVDLCCHHNTHPRHPAEKRRVVCQALLSFFISLNEQDEQEMTPVTGSDFWETEAEGSEGDWQQDRGK